MDLVGSDLDRHRILADGSGRTKMSEKLTFSRSIRFDASLMERTQREADARGMMVSQVVRLALEQFLDDDDDQGGDLSTQLIVDGAGKSKWVQLRIEECGGE